MKHLFIPYNLAVIAKEKGFDEPCLGFYPTSTYDIYTEGQFILGSDLHGCKAPLYQQTVDWFREKHKIHIEISHRRDDEYAVYNLNDKGVFYRAICKGYYDSYNLAITESFKLI